uniref:Uncharacterized protein n=1 Tax=Solanum tuberosum TaxID=4113 RepID=M1E0S3_SOLTU
MLVALAEPLSEVPSGILFRPFLQNLQFSEGKIDGLHQDRRIDCAAEVCSATLVEIADELGDPPSGQLIAFSVLPLASLHYGSLSGIVLLRETNR